MAFWTSPWPVVVLSVSRCEPNVSSVRRRAGQCQCASDARQRCEAIRQPFDQSIPLDQARWMGWRERVDHWRALSAGLY